MKTKLITAILTLLACVSFSFNCQADNPPKQDQEDVAETSVRRTVIVEDTGYAVLDKDLFCGIPDTAVCHLTVLRGDIEILDYENETYKVLAETHEYLSFVLIREIAERHEQ